LTFLLFELLTFHVRQVNRRYSLQSVCRLTFRVDKSGISGRSELCSVPSPPFLRLLRVADSTFGTPNRYYHFQRSSQVPQAPLRKSKLRKYDSNSQDSLRLTAARISQILTLVESSWSAYVSPSTTHTLPETHWCCPACFVWSAGCRHWSLISRLSPHTRCSEVIFDGILVLPSMHSGRAMKMRSIETISWFCSAAF
jgi:hypothetical protein